MQKQWRTDERHQHAQFQIALGQDFPHGDIGGEDKCRSAKGRRPEQGRGAGTNKWAQEMRHHQSHETNRPGDGCRGTDCCRCPEYQSQPQTRQTDAESLSGILSKRQSVQSSPGRKQK
jgi:hypothetical protein